MRTTYLIMLASLRTITYYLADPRRLISDTSCTMPLYFSTSTCLSCSEAFSLEEKIALLNAGPHKYLALIPDFRKQIQFHCCAY